MGRCSSWPTVPLLGWLWADVWLDNQMDGWTPAWSIDNDK